MDEGIGKRRMLSDRSEVSKQTADGKISIGRWKVITICYESACTLTGIFSLTISSTKQLKLEIRLAVSTTKGHVSSSVVPEQTRPYNATLHLYKTHEINNK